MSEESLKQTVYIVDDDERVRDALGMLLDSVGLPVNAFESANDFIDRFDGAPGLVVLDVRMPGISGLEMQKVLAQKRFAGLAVIIMTGHGDISMAVETLKQGALDFLTKPFRDQQLLDCLHRALEANEKRLGKASGVDAIESRLAQLTPREKQVLAKVADGQPNKVIAMELGISQRTVEIHRSRAMRKMDSKSLAHLVRMLDGVQFFDHV